MPTYEYECQACGHRFDQWQSIKADALTNSIPVLAVTAYALDGDADIARESGCAGYIAKPYDPAVLIREARRLTDAPG